VTEPEPATTASPSPDTLPESPPAADTSLLPALQGAIPRVEFQQAHRDFLEGVRPPAALLSIVHGRRLLRAGYRLEEWFPAETSVITTTTVADSKLARLSPNAEWGLVRCLEPAYHIPADFPVYGDMTPEIRTARTDAVATGTRVMADALRGTPTTVLPLIKGSTPRERARCYEVVRQLEPPAVVEYATQYFSTPGNGQFPALRDSLTAITAETEGHVPILTLGFQSPTGKYSLRALPDEIPVRAASGLHRWLSRVSPRSNTPTEMRAAYASFAMDVGRAVGAPPDSRYDDGSGGVPDGRRE